MSPIGMDEPARKKPVPLVLLRYSWRVKNQVVNYLWIGKTSDRNKRGDNDDDKGYGKLHLKCVIYGLCLVVCMVLFMVIFFIAQDSAGPIDLF
jgi:hypothetical protein